MKYLIMCFTLLPCYLIAQNPIVEWAKTFGGSLEDFANSITITTDNKYVIAGNTQSNDGDVSNFKGGSDVWLVKLDENGNVLWKRNYGGTKNESMDAIIQTLDNGFIMVGSTNSSDGDVTENKGDFDAWIIKIDSLGNIQWQKTLGGTKTDYATTIFQTQNGEYILGINSNSSDLDFGSNSGDYDWWFVKLSNQGNTVWKERLGGTKEDILSEIVNIDDKTFAVAGTTDSRDGDMFDAKGDFSVKMDSSGKVIWKKSFGSPFDTLEGLKGFNGVTMSAKNIISVGTQYVVYPQGHDAWDYLVTKSDTVGNSKWSKIFGGTDTDIASSVKAFSNGDLLIIGYTKSNDTDIKNNNGGIDTWILRIDSLGNIKNSNCYGGLKLDFPTYGAIDKNGAVIIVGASESTNGTFLPNRGKVDWAILKLKYDAVDIKETAFTNMTITEYPNPTKSKLSIHLSTDVSLIFSIYDIKGKLMYHTNYLPQDSIIDMNLYPNGSYILIYHLNGQYLTKKILKM